MNDQEMNRAFFEIAELSSENNNLKELLRLKNEYIAILGEELDETVPIAFNHHWRSSRYEIGEKMRAKILTVEEKLGITKGDSK